MSSKFNDVLEMIESLSIEEQEDLLEIERKRLIDKKRKKLIDDINESRKDISEGNYTIGNADDIMKAIDNETDIIK